MASHQTKLKLSDLYELLEEQNYRCALTGNVLSPDDVALDHIVTISTGGDFSAANSQLVSKAANRAKHTLSQSDFILLCNRVAENQRVPDESDNKVNSSSQVPIYFARDSTKQQGLHYDQH